MQTELEMCICSVGRLQNTLKHMQCPSKCIQFSRPLGGMAQCGITACISPLIWMLSLWAALLHLPLVSVQTSLACSPFNFNTFLSFFASHPPADTDAADIPFFLTIHSFIFLIFYTFQWLCLCISAIMPPLNLFEVNWSTSVFWLWPKSHWCSQWLTKSQLPEPLLLPSSPFLPFVLFILQKWLPKASSPLSLTSSKCSLLPLFRE